MRTVVLCAILASTPCLARTITVDDDGPADYASIQEAINTAGHGDTVQVSPGIYNEHAHFRGKRILLTSLDPTSPEVVSSTIIDAGGTGNGVTFNNGEDGTSVLDGFTIQNGDNGIECYYSSPVLRRCVIRQNNTGLQGKDSEAFPRIEACTVEQNRTGVSRCDGELVGCTVRENHSGIYLGTGRLVRSLIEDNLHVGVMGRKGTIAECIIRRNGHGLESCNGGIHNCNVTDNFHEGLVRCNADIRLCDVARNGRTGLHSCTGTVAYTLIHNNVGNGITSFKGVIQNCTVVGNRSDGVAYGVDAHHCTIKNSLIAYNGGWGIRPGSADIVAEYNNLWRNLRGAHHGGSLSSTNVEVDPLFAVDGYWDLNQEWVEGDYHLKSETGRWDPGSESWVSDEESSPCIDAGDPESVIGQEPNPNGGRINIGAYGGTVEASKSPSGIVEPICKKRPAMDFTGDCRVTLSDFAHFAAQWLTCGLDIQEACWD